MEDAPINNDNDELIESDYISDKDFYILRLYVAGQTAKSLAAFANKRSVWSTWVAGTVLRLEIS